MRILFFAGRERSYTRNDVLIRALRQFATVDIAGGQEHGSIMRRTIGALIHYISLVRKNKYDLYLVGFYGHLIMLILPQRQQPPIIFDPFISTFDTLINDRKTFSPGSLISRLAFWIDNTACHKANLLLYDTKFHQEFFQRTFDLEHKPQFVIPVSCNEDLFQPIERVSERDNVLLYYCTYLPLHGVDIVLKALALFPEGNQVRLRLVGDGPGEMAARKLVEDLGLSNVDFFPPTHITSLPAMIAEAAICLGGPFGVGDKADRVVPGKVYQLMSMGKAIIAGDTSANRELLVHSESAYLCSRNDPQALAEAIQALFGNPELRAILGKGAKEKFQKHTSERIVYKKLKSIILELLASDFG